MNKKISFLFLVLFGVSVVLSVGCDRRKDVLDRNNPITLEGKQKKLESYKHDKKILEKSPESALSRERLRLANIEIEKLEKEIREFPN
jgi:hypothetical protein